MINVADMESDDAPGKTRREVNAEKRHSIPLGTLVEIVRFDEDPELAGVRVFVVRHTRDCDETPLYVLSLKPLSVIQEYEAKGAVPDLSSRWFAATLAGMLDGGYPEYTLKVIRLPKINKNVLS